MKISEFLADIERTKKKFLPHKDEYDAVLANRPLLIIDAKNFAKVKDDGSIELYSVSMTVNQAQAFVDWFATIKG